MPSTAAPIATMIATGCFAKTAAIGTRTRAPAALDRLEHRRLADRPAQVEATEQQREGRQERIRQPHATMSRAADGREHQQEQQTGEDRADRRAELREGRPERPALLIQLLGREQDGATPLAAEGEPWAIRNRMSSTAPSQPAVWKSGSTPISPGRQPHHEDGDEERLAASEPVADPAEDDRADRADHEGDRDRQERGDRPAHGTRRFEEQRADEERGEIGEHVEVVGLESRSDE